MADILLVEDKDSLRRVLRLTIENACYSVTEAVDASSALNEIPQTRRRLILTDLTLRLGERKIADVLEANSGNKSKPAEDPGISYKTLLNKTREYAL